MLTALPEIIFVSYCADRARAKTKHLYFFIILNVHTKLSWKIVIIISL